MFEPWLIAPIASVISILILCSGIVSFATDYDSFSSYEIKTKTRFNEKVIFIDDSLDTGSDFQVYGAGLLYNNIIEINGSQSNSPTTHFTGYRES